MIFAESYIGSKDFWNTLLSAIVGIAVGAAAVLATLKAQNPKRRIVWEEGINHPLVPRSPAGSPYPVSITVGPVGPLPEARLVDLTIRNAGRRDVERTDFTLEDESLVFDFGVHIVTVMSASVSPLSAPLPEVALNGSEFKIRKSPLLRGQEITYSVIVNGPESESKVKVKTQAILNTPVKKANSGRKGNLLHAAGIMMAVIAGGWFWFFAVPDKLNEFEDSILLEKCRYWDAHDPDRAKKECPEIKKP